MFVDAREKRGGECMAEERVVEIVFREKEDEKFINSLLEFLKNLIISAEEK